MAVLCSFLELFIPELIIKCIRRTIYSFRESRCDSIVLLPRTRVSRSLVKFGINYFGRVRVESRQLIVYSREAKPKKS